MQPIGTLGVIPQLVNPQVMVAPGRSSRKGSGGSKKKGSCSSCGRCFGSLFVILFAIICTSCCYAYPIYNSFTNPNYFKQHEKPIWTWRMALNKVKDLGYSMSIISSPINQDENEVKKASNSSETTRRIEDYLRSNISDLILSESSNSFADLFNSTGNRKLSIRGAGGGLQNNIFTFKKKATPNKYFNREYCGEEERRAWSELCNVKHNVTNLECIDMLNGPAICVGIRNRGYEVFSVSKECKFLEPELPVEVFPAVSSFCSSGNSSKGNSLLCPCLITANLVDSIFNNTSLSPSSGNNGTILDKLVGLEAQKQLRGGREVMGSFNGNFGEQAAKHLELFDNGNHTVTLGPLLAP
ncbi:hypothetical protein HWI79_875 [Cryptosporidium felis]|nr:hypothetical protein HWI79_875 [Cryptosporidium felis]